MQKKKKNFKLFNKAFTCYDYYNQHIISITSSKLTNLFSYVLENDYQQLNLYEDYQVH